MKKSQMKATTLRGLLIFIAIILIGLCIAGFYFAQSWLSDYAKSVGQTVANSSATNNNVQSLKTLQASIAERQDALIKSSSLLSSPQNFQTQAVQDIGTYATAAGITVSNYAFAASTATPTTPTAVKGSTTPTELVTLTVTSPMSYTKLLTFITEIEGNLPKMQVSSINLGRIPTSNGQVTVDGMVIEVFT